MASGFVVLAMGDLPGKVGDQKSRVADPAHGVVQDLAGRERLVSALVSQDPQSGAKEALDNSIQKPETSSERSRRDGFGGDKTIEEIKGGGQ